MLTKLINKIKEWFYNKNIGTVHNKNISTATDVINIPSKKTKYPLRIRSYIYTSPNTYAIRIETNPEYEDLLKSQYLLDTDINCVDEIRNNVTKKLTIRIIELLRSYNIESYRYYNNYSMLGGIALNLDMTKDDVVDFIVSGGGNMLKDRLNSYIEELSYEISSAIEDKCKKYKLLSDKIKELVDE